MNTIRIETIPHEQQRYTTVGDWFYEPDGTLVIRVSKLSDNKREFLIALHELIEVKLCEAAGITQVEVDYFDMVEFSYAEHPDEEPGDNPHAPYRRQHCIATGVERLIAAELDVDWKDYEDELGNLPEIPKKD